jgi:hypothetical protein
MLTILFFVSSCSTKTETSNSLVTESIEKFTRIDSGKTEPKLQENLPDFVKATKLPDSLVIDVSNMISGDFNADEKDDFASLVVNQNNRLRGILVIHNMEKPEYFTFGVSEKIKGITNLNTIEIFKEFPRIKDVKPDVVDVVTGETVEENSKILRIIGDAIYTRFDDSKGGEVLFWTGDKYDWFHFD